MTNRSDEVASAAHRSGKQEVQTPVGRVDARKLLEHLYRFVISATSEVNAGGLKSDRRVEAATLEFLGQQRRGFNLTPRDQHDARQFSAGSAERGSFGDRAAEAMLGALEVAAGQQAARNFEMRRRWALDGVKRHVVRRLRLIMATGLRERTDEKRRGRFAGWVEAQRGLEREHGIGVAIEFRKQHALSKPRIARVGQEGRRLAVLLQRFVVAADGLESPAELQHPVTARRIDGDRGAQFAFSVLEPALTEHLSSAIRVLFAFAHLSHWWSCLARRYALSSAS